MNVPAQVIDRLFTAVSERTGLGSPVMALLSYQEKHSSKYQQTWLTPKIPAGAESGWFGNFIATYQVQVDIYGCTNDGFVATTHVWYQHGKFGSSGSNGVSFDLVFDHKDPTAGWMTREEYNEQLALLQEEEPNGPPNG